MFLLAAEQTIVEWWDGYQLDLFVVIPFLAYMIAVFGIAIVAHRYLTTKHFEEEYYVGSRSFGTWVLAMSWVATMASGGSFLGYPSLVYSYGWSVAFWVSGSTVAALVGLGIVGKRINRLARQTNALTLVDLLRDRYKSKAIGIAYAIVVIFVTFVYLVAQFAAGARILKTMLGMPYVLGLALFAVSVIAYTTYGGFRAVAWTDTLQGIVMIIGIVLLVPFALYQVSISKSPADSQVVQGPDAKVNALEKATFELAERKDPTRELVGEPTPRHTYLYPPGPRKVDQKIFKEHEETGLVPALKTLKSEWLAIGMGISFFMLRSLGSLMMPTTVSRMLSFKDTKALRRALIILAPYIMLMYGSSLITMNCAHSLGIDLAPGNSDDAVPELAKVVAPGWLAGILIAAPFAAVMSTVDSALLVVSGAIVRDLGQKSFKLKLSESGMKRFTYIVTAGIGLVAFFLAISPPDFLIDLVIFHVGGSVAALMVPSLATLFWKRMNRHGMLWGMLGGLVAFIISDQLARADYITVFHPFLFGVAVSLLMTVTIALMTPPQEEWLVERYFGKE
jgi:sodium/pantothenate symporter